MTFATALSAAGIRESVDFAATAARNTGTGFNAVTWFAPSARVGGMPSGCGRANHFSLCPLKGAQRAKKRKKGPWKGPPTAARLPPRGEAVEPRDPSHLGGGPRNLSPGSYAVHVAQATWCNLRGASYVTQAMWRKLCGASHVVQSMWCKLCGARYAV